MSDRDLADFSGRSLGDVNGRSVSDASGRDLATSIWLKPQEFPWTFPLWFSDVQIRELVTATGRDLNDG